MPFKISSFRGNCRFGFAKLRRFGAQGENPSVKTAFSTLKRLFALPK
jgi:hypothetical protein